MDRRNNPNTWGQPGANAGADDSFQQNQVNMQPSTSSGQQTQRSQNFRGRGRGNGRKNQNQKPFQKADKPQGVPEPLHLSKTSSELKNDPLYDEAFFPSPSDELREISKESEIFPGAEGLIPLVNEIYLDVCARSHNYKRNVSLSAHTYYFGTILYARMLSLQRANKRMLSFDEEQFAVQIMEQGGFTVPQSFQRYLAGFGNTSLPSGVKQWFNMNKPELDEANGLLGYFGPIGIFPGAYASYPCPGVLAQRIMEDLRFTVERNDPDWDLPPQFLLEDCPINQNCIGYARAVALTGDQVQFFGTKHIVHDEFRSVNNSLPVNPQLLNGVQKFLSEVPGLKLMPTPTNDVGSQGQLVTVKVSDFTRRHERMLYVAKAPLRINGSIAFLGSSYLYKFRKSDYNDLDVLHLYPNNFDHPDAQIPDEYHPSFVLNDQDLDQKLDHYDYESTPFMLPLRMKHVTSFDITEKN